MKHFDYQIKVGQIEVTPRVGVWIETFVCVRAHERAQVTPRVGVWIETAKLFVVWFRFYKSLPAWECGLKHGGAYGVYVERGHSPRGSVD